MAAMTDLGGQVALVTGGAVGIGRGVALRLAAAGAEIAVTYHNHSPAELLGLMDELGKKALALPMEADNSQSVDYVVELVYEHFGHLDIVVANAGGLLARVPLATMSDEHWHEVLEVNLSSAFYLARASLKRISKPGGRVILMSSMAAHTGGSGGAGAYAAAKAGLLGLARALAKEIAPLGVTVNALAPGLILGTPFHETFTKPEDQAATIARLPVGRPGSPEDVAGLIAYLASAEAGFITGQVVNVAGGQELT
jgi:3-oxoacyl-[acyl-carrier protein] reductase